ncbi:MAG TPA: SGNH/GDSL hydrolase family protein [Pelolinea sp.]|nr:SGNH/GDSL hydrolase family protein [Pelolinea sp.]
MSAKRFFLVLSILGLTLLWPISCKAGNVIEQEPVPQEMQMGVNAVWDLVVIGDSSLWGCGKAFAEQIAKDNAVEVELDDFTLGGLSAGEVVDALNTGKSQRLQLEALPEALRNAEVVVMFVNPENSEVSGMPIEIDPCFFASQPGSCEMDRFAQYISDLESIWARILELRGGQPIILRATDIYNPLIDHWQNTGVFEECNACWINLSTATRTAAENMNIPFLSRYDAFNGVDHKEDPNLKGYIRGDGEHPTELASEYTATLLSKMGYAPYQPQE